MIARYALQSGWRDIFKPEPFTEREAFLWSVEKAVNHRAGDFSGIDDLGIDRGEIQTSVYEMARVFRWSEQRVRSVMKRMETAGRWRIRRNGPRLIVIAIVDFDQLMAHDPAAAR